MMFEKTSLSTAPLQRTGLIVQRHARVSIIAMAVFAMGCAGPTTIESTPPSAQLTAGPGPTPIDDMHALPASEHGTVVDFDSNLPLAGVRIAIAPFTSANAAYVTVATSAADGTFAFATEPGYYILAIGSNQPSDSTRATYHQAVVFDTASSPITAPMPMAVPQATILPSQRSGAFRLALLSAAERRCFAGINTGRRANALKPLVYDELGLENVRAIAAEQQAQGTAYPVPLSNDRSAYEYYPEPATLIAKITTSSCDAVASASSSGPATVPFGANAPSVGWYAAATVPALTADPAGSFVDQIFMVDPASSH